MKFITTRAHGILDYLVGVILVATPWMLRFDSNGPATSVMTTLGVSTILYSIITDYELGVIKLLPMKTHLVLDALGGLLLATSPWVFGFSDVVFWPHVLLGIVELCVVATTKVTTATVHHSRHYHA